VRILNMRGVDLNVFEFDYDLTWSAFFLNAEEKIYGRFGGRDAVSADKYLTLSGLKNAMRAALAAHRREPIARPAVVSRPAVSVEQYPAVTQLKANACVHCHQVYDFRRQGSRTAGKWRLDDAWVYPLPEKLGFTLDPDSGQRLASVAADSAAARAGLEAGDLLTRIHGRPVASFADAQYALHHAPAEGTITVSWQHAGQLRAGTLELTPGWRKTDISWRASMWGLEPAPCVHGKDLTAAEKKALGLAENHLAFRQGRFVPVAARMAGIQENDIILGIDDRDLELTMLQFNAYVRLNYKVGERITFTVLRNGERLKLPMTLPNRAQF